MQIAELDILSLELFIKEFGLRVNLELYMDKGYSRSDGLLIHCKMPVGYALMETPDDMKYFWLRFDGQRGELTDDRFSCFRSAVQNYKLIRANATPEKIKERLQNLLDIFSTN